MRSFVAAVLLVGIHAGTSQAQLANDRCMTATNVSVLPFATSVDIDEATDDPEPPSSYCGTSSRNAWFAVSASTATTILVEASPVAEGYATVEVFAGDCGALVDQGCDSGSSNAAEVLVPIAAGQTLYVAVSGNVSPVSLRIEAVPIDVTPATVSAAVTTGDPSPLGGTFSAFGPSVLLTSELLAFSGTTEGVFADLGGGVQPVALAGDPAPGGGTYGAIRAPEINAAGDVFFVANVEGGPSSSAIFRRSGGTTTALVRSGDVAPNGVVFRRFSRWIGVNDAGDVVFVAGTNRFDDAVWVWHDGVLIGPALSVFDSTPCGSVNRLGSSQTLAINAAGDIAVFVQASSSRRGILRIAGGMIVAAICEDAPAPGGGTYRTLSDEFAFGDPPSNAIVFRSTTTSASARLYRYDDLAGITVVAAPGDVTTTGETITAILAPPATIDADGDVGFRGRIGLRNAVFVRPASAAPPTLLTAVDAACPAGGTVRSLGTIAGDETGRLVVSAACSSSAGVFDVGDGSGLTAVATDGTSTPIGAGLLFGDATIRSGRTVIRGSRTAVYQRRCSNGVCGAVEVVASQYDAVPGISDRLWDMDPASLTGRKGQVVFSSGTLGGREVVVAARHGDFETVAVTGTPLDGTTFTPTALLRDGGVGTDGNSIAFIATGTDADGVERTVAWLARRGRFRAMLRTDDTVAVGGEPSAVIDVRRPLVKGGTVTVSASLDVADCWIELRGGSARPLVCDGFPMPDGALPGSVSLVFDALAALSNRGLVVSVRADTFLDSCLLAARRGNLQPLTCSGDPLPGGGSVDSLTEANIAADGSRIVAAIGGSSRSGLFAIGKARFAMIAEDGGVSPVGTGGTWDIFTARPSIAGTVVSFDATITRGAHAGVIALAKLAR
jgi:hypothetical protein